MKTRLCELLGIEYPIIQGGMAWVADHHIAAAVSEAGGLGLIAAANAPAEWVREQIREAKKLTDKTPADFIRSFRLQEAEKRLRTTSKTVQEIMADCGFKNKAHFYREFAKLYHATPKEYRMTVSNTGEQDPQK